VGAISWEGRVFGAGDLFRAAREARRAGWLSARSSKFLFYIGVCLLADRPVTPKQLAFLARLLRRLRRHGSTLFRTGEVGPTWDSASEELEALERDLAAMRLFLASATERVEGYWERLQQLKRRLRQ
jgi:molybdopterin-biosynthesis enzyme MoeA-like protein